MTHTIRQLAEQYQQAFILTTKHDGTQCVTVEEPVDEILLDMLFDAQDTDLPDDFCYRFTYEALAALANGDNPHECLACLEADVTDAELTGWLNAQSYRSDYLTEAQRTHGRIQDGRQLLATAQLLEKADIFQKVLTSLQRLAQDHDA